MSDRPDLGAALALGIGGGLRAFAPGVAFAAAAVGSAFAGSQLRMKVHKRVRQLVAATAEDALSYSLVLTPRPRCTDPSSPGQTQPAPKPMRQ